MSMNRRAWTGLSVAYVLFASFTANAQTLVGQFPVEGGPISLTALDGDIVASGLDFRSDSGSLTPASGDSAPFSFFLSNTPNQVTYGNLGSTVTFSQNNTVELSVGARAETEDIVAEWGDGATPVAFEVSPSGNRLFQVGLNRDLNWVLSGREASISQFQLNSDGGSLRPATSASPFTSLQANTANSVRYSNDTPLVLDGSVTLSSGWNVGHGARDVTYEYFNASEQRSVGPIQVRQNRYPAAPPSTPLRGSVDDDFRIVVSGRNKLVDGLEFFSQTGSLVPSDNLAPFESASSNTSGQVSLSSNQLVSINGVLTLNVGWNPTKSRDVTFQYDEFGIPDTQGPFFITTYPRLPSIPRLDVNTDFQLVLRGNGIDLGKVRFESPSGSLTTATSTEPFQFLTSNTPNAIEFSNEGAGVRLDGSMVLSAGWKAINSEKDIDFRYSLSGSLAEFGEFGPYGVTTYPARPPATLGLAEDLHFVMRGNGQTVDGLNIQSAGGALVPSDVPSPFSEVGESTKFQVDLVGGPVTVDGEIKLAAAWNSLERRDVRYTYDGGRQQFVASDEYPPRAPIGNMQFRLDDRNNFVMQGNGNELRAVRFSSPSRSLLPGESPAPFVEFGENTSRRVNYRTPSFVKLDGELTLDAQYNPNVGGKDVSIAVHEVGNPGFQRVGQIVDYPETTPPVNVSLDRENRFVLTGQGEQLLGLELVSPSGSLVVAGTNQPFDITLSNSSRNLTFGVLGAENAVTLDGSIALSSGWNPLGSPDVEYSYGLIGGANVGPFKLFREPPAELDVVRVSLNDDFNWVLNGTGQQLEQFDLWSEKGGLIPASSPTPFTDLTLNDEETIRFETNGNVTVDGELTLAAGWNFDLGVRDVRYWYREAGQELNAGPFVVPGDIYPPAPNSTQVRVTIDDVDRKFVLNGNGHWLRTFEFESPSGSLNTAETPAPFESLAENTKNRIAFEMPGHVTLEGTLKLDAGYDIDVAGEDVSYRYRQVGIRTLRGPFDISSREYPPNPRKSPLRVAVNNDLQLVVSGIGQPVTSITFQSEGGSLEGGEDPAPFDEFLRKTAEEIELGSLGLVRIDGQLTLPVSWNEKAADVEFVYSLEGSDEVFGPLEIGSRNYPGPNVISVPVSFNGGSIAFVGSGQLITGFEVRSPSGALEYVTTENFTPFEIAEERAPEFAKFTSTEPIPVNWVRLPFIKWDADKGADLEFSFQVAGSRAVIAQISYVRPGVPEPGSNLLGCFAFLGLVFVRRSRAA